MRPAAGRAPVTRRVALTGALLAALAALSSAAGPRWQLIVRDQQHHDRIYLRVPVTEGQTVEFAWTHSVDHTPWSEYYRIHAGRLLLDCSVVELTGAGTPYEAPRVELRNGKTWMCGMNREFPALRWIHSHRVNHRFYLDGEPLLTTDQIPHHLRAELLLSAA